MPSGGTLLPGLDALRGVAVLAVFTQHLGDTHLPFVRARLAEVVPGALLPWILTVLHHAHWGVDLFFVLSGFSLAQPLLRRLARSGPAGQTSGSPGGEGWIRSFAVRRVARIYPAYLLALCLVLAVVPSLWIQPAFYASLASHLVMLQGYLLPGGLAFIGAAWSLSTEVSFYVVWPLLGPRVLRSFRVGIAIILVGWALRAVLHDVALAEGAPSWLLEAACRRWAVSRLDQFLLGALAAVVRDRLVRGRADLRAASRWALLSPRLAPWLMFAALLVLVPAFYLEGSFYGKPFGAWPYTLVSIATAMLVFASAELSPRACRWLLPWPLQAVGLISYGVFLNHQLAIGMTLAPSGPPGTFGALAKHTAFALSLSLLLGGLSWVLVERPAIVWASGRKKPTGALVKAEEAR